MISTGIIRSIDNLGRIVLPKELRSSYGITPETPLEIMTEGEMILLRKYQPADACIFCNEVKPGTVMLHGKRICPTCRRELEKLEAPPTICAIQKTAALRRSFCVAGQLLSRVKPRMASSAFFTRFSKLVAWRG